VGGGQPTPLTRWFRQRFSRGQIHPADGNAILAGFLKRMVCDHDGSRLVNSHGYPVLFSTAVLLIEFRKSGYIMEDSCRTVECNPALAVILSGLRGSHSK